MLKNKIFIKRLLLSIGLFILWIALTFLYILEFDSSLSILSYAHGKENIHNVTNEKLLKGKKISGTFTATENNLGIVSIRFNTFIRPPYKDEDMLVFRLKEVGTKDWYYQNNYRIGFIYDVPVFPFGFPKIPDSQGKTYYFEIESLKGNLNNSVALSDKGQIFFSRYQVEKSILLHDKKELSVFAVKKLVSAILTTDIKFSSFIYLLPFLFYIFWIIPVGNSQKNRLSVIFYRYIVSYFHFITIGVVLIDIFLIQVTNDIIYLVIPFLWIATLRVNNKGSQMTFIVALCIFLIAPLFLLLKDSQTSEKGAAWAFMFLVAGMIQILLELRKSSQHENKRTKKLNLH